VTLEIDPAVCLFASDVKLHELHVMAAVGVQVLVVNDYLLGHILVYFKFGKELAGLHVPYAYLGIDAASDQVGRMKHLQAVDDRALVGEYLLHCLCV